MIQGIIILGVLLFAGAFFKSLDFNPFNFIFGIKNNKSNPPKESKPAPTDPDLTWDQWERENS